MLHRSETTGLSGFGFMRIATLLLAVAAILLGGCASSDSGGGARPSTTAGQTAPPDPDEPIPRDSAALARRLTETTAALYGAIDRWRDRRGKTPEEVTLPALHQQRIHLLLTGRPALARRVVARLPTRLARDV